jgi:dTDP-4-dehydrorhamnose reductase
MRILITGSAGMLGSAVYPAFVRAGHQTTATDLVPREVEGLPMSVLDVRDHAAVGRSVERVEPDLIVHLAAETDLETCEADPLHATRTNAGGTQNVALIAADRDIPLVYVSTAGVFDGSKTDGPYTELDPARPINIYGSTKLEGERIVERHVRRHFIVRAGWMIGGGDRDHKFVAKILRQIDDGARVLHAVTDKLGTPTYTEDFAANLMELIASPHYGRYHMACRGEGSRYDVARALLDHLGVDIELVPVTSEFFAVEYPAPRPRSEAMRNLMLEVHGMDRMRHWRDALGSYLDATVPVLRREAITSA